MRPDDTTPPVTSAEKKRARDRRYYEAHREEIIAKQIARDATRREAKCAYAKEYRVRCADKIAEWQRQYYQANRERIRERDDEYHRTKVSERFAPIRELVTSLTCCDCDRKAQVWHHVDPSQKHRDVSKMAGYSAESIANELSKCVPLCRSCHKKRHDRMREG